MGRTRTVRVGIASVCLLVLALIALVPMLNRDSASTDFGVTLPWQQMPDRIYEGITALERTVNQDTGEANISVAGANIYLGTYEVIYTCMNDDENGGHLHYLSLMLKGKGFKTSSVFQEGPCSAPGEPVLRDLLRRVLQQMGLEEGEFISKLEGFSRMLMDLIHGPLPPLP